MSKKSNEVRVKICRRYYHFEPYYGDGVVQGLIDHNSQLDCIRFSAYHVVLTLRMDISRCWCIYCLRESTHYRGSVVMASLLLFFGYKGTYATEIQELLAKNRKRWALLGLNFMTDDPASGEERHTEIVPEPPTP